MKCFVSFFFCVIFTSGLYADVKIYLYPNVKISGAELHVGDIGFVEGSSEGAEKMRECVIDRKYFCDAIVDRKELIEIASGEIDEPFIVIGSAVKLMEADGAEKAEREVLVYKGDRVEVVLARRGIVLEFSGVIQADAAKGERVVVDMGKKGCVKGVLSADKKVEVHL